MNPPIHKTTVEIRAAVMFMRLRGRQPEMETAVFQRVRSLSPSTLDNDTEYTVGLREAVAAVLDWGLAWLERGEEPSGQIPSTALGQARLAARRGTSLDTIVLRLIAGHRLLACFVRDEADDSGVSSHSRARRTLLNTQDALLERLMVTIVEEYKRELVRAGESSEQRRKESIQRLLAGEPLDTADLSYDFDGWHLGIIGVSARAREAVQEVARGVRRPLLTVCCGERAVWAWLGGTRPLAADEVARQLLSDQYSDVSLAVGEPAEGLAGWRRTHEEAQAALRVATRRPQRVTRCADVPLEAALLRDEATAGSLVASYLMPLDGLRMGRQVARETLHAYFACERNAASTAHRLGLQSRHTVTNRLRKIEQALGRSLHRSLPELEIALRLDAYSEGPEMDPSPAVRR
jgi:hypothetical protein